MQNNPTNDQTPENNGWKNEENKEDTLNQSEIIDQEEQPAVSQPDPSLPPSELEDITEENEIEDSEETEVGKAEKVADQDPFSEPKETETLSEGTPSRFNRALRHGIRWVVGVLIIFGLGFLVGIFLLYRPAVQEGKNNVAQVETKLADANEMISELNNQVSNLNSEITRLEPLGERNETLLDENNNLNLHISILDARLDVANAQLALETDDNTQARIILNQTSLALNTIEELLEVDQKEVVSDLKQRLDLVMDELEDDPFAAQSDLEVLEIKLLQLEDSLFGQ